MTLKKSSCSRVTTADSCKQQVAIAIGEKSPLAAAVGPGLPQLVQPKLRAYKNIFVLSFSMLVLFTAFRGVQNLQSSINSSDGLGLASLSVIYGLQVVCCVLFPKWIIGAIGCKSTLVISIVGYGVYLALNLYPSFWTLMPGSIIVGVISAPLQVARGAYTAELAHRKAVKDNLRADAVMGQFSGIFFTMFQSSQIWGNLIASEVLNMADTSRDTNFTSETLGVILNDCCGRNYCGSQQVCNINGTVVENENLERPSDVKIYTLFGIYVACAFVSAVFLALFLDPLKSSMETEESKSKRLSLNLLIATLKHLKHPEQLLLLPITVYSGLSQAFIMGDFTKAFVTCSWGVHHVGYVMLTFGVCAAACSITAGKLAKYTGRIPFIVGAAFINLAAMLAMMLWLPNDKETHIFFILAGGWGLADGVWMALVDALYGVLFRDNKEVAFANRCLWMSLGHLMAFSYSDKLCVTTKVYILIALLLPAMILYLNLDIRYTHWGKGKRQHSVQTQSQSPAGATGDGRGDGNEKS